MEGNPPGFLPWAILPARSGFSAGAHETRRFAGSFIHEHSSLCSQRFGVERTMATRRETSWTITLPIPRSATEVCGLEERVWKVSDDHHPLYDFRERQPTASRYPRFSLTSSLSLQGVAPGRRSLPSRVLLKESVRSMLRGIKGAERAHLRGLCVFLFV